MKPLNLCPSFVAQILPRSSRSAKTTPIVEEEPVQAPPLMAWAMAISSTIVGTDPVVIFHLDPTRSPDFARSSAVICGWQQNLGPSVARQPTEKHMRWAPHHNESGRRVSKSGALGVGD